MYQFKETIEKELQSGTDISVVNLVDHLVMHAWDMNASDIHIEPEEKSVRIRFRIDGNLEDSFALPKNIHNEIISRIKVLSNLRTDEHQSAQDGRFSKTIHGATNIDIRASVIPTYYGENVVLRLLFNKNKSSSLENLGFMEADRGKIVGALRKSTGMILVTGPTGSGKTTTLYTLIKILNSQAISIVTVEDPIEYAILGVKQIQVNTSTGLTFANGLRSILRQDPDIVMVGEIRDTETAGIAVNASLTGHLLLSTLHTNDASTTLPRLLDMKIEPFLLSSTISIAIGQRLVRRICDNCKEKKTFNEKEYQYISDIIKKGKFECELNFFEGRGCRECKNTGYKGRIIIDEVLVVNDDIRNAILSKTSSNNIKKIAVENGMTTMLVDGFNKASLGLTTIEEVLRVTNEL